MTRGDVFKYVKKEYGISPDYPFDKDFESAVLRHADSGKWFAIIMSVKADRLGYRSNEQIDVITLKSEPMLIDSLAAHNGFHRAYHMNKTMWLTIELTDTAADGQVKELIDMSYGMTEKHKGHISG